MLELKELEAGSLHGWVIKAAQASSGLRAVWKIALALALTLGIESFAGTADKVAAFVNAHATVVESANRNTGLRFGIFKEDDKIRLVPFRDKGSAGCVPGDSDCYLELSIEHGMIGLRGAVLAVMALILFLVSSLLVEWFLGHPAVLMGRSFTMTHNFSETAEGADLCTITRIYEGVRTNARRFVYPLQLSYDQFNEGEGESQPRFVPGSLMLTPLDDSSRKANVRLSPHRPGVASYSGDIVADSGSGPFSFRVDYKVLNIFPKDAETARRRSGGQSAEDSTEWEPKAFWEEVQLHFIDMGPLREAPRLFTKVAGADDEREVQDAGWKPHAWMLTMRNVPQDRHLLFKWRLRER